MFNCSIHILYSDSAGRGWSDTGWAHVAITMRVMVVMVVVVVVVVVVMVMVMVVMVVVMVVMMMVKIVSLPSLREPSPSPVLRLFYA